MLSRLSRIWYPTVNFFIVRSRKLFLAGLWHRLMPSFPVRRRVFDLDIYFDSRDHPFVWYSSRNILEEAENLPAILAQFHGLFWDVGANAGLYTFWMASRGNPVIAFDISPKAISYVLKSAARNGFKNVTGVARAFSVEPFRYRMPETAIAGNSLQAAPDGANATAITYLEAAAQFGVPAVIKMDIEGHEEVFLRSKEFKEWLIRNRIALILELHKPEYWDLIWKDMKYVRLSECVIIIQPPAA